MGSLRTILSLIQSSYYFIYSRMAVGIRKAEGWHKEGFNLVHGWFEAGKRQD